MLKIRCRMCGTEVHGSGTCGCPNMASIRNNNVTASDLSQIVMIESNYNQKQNKYLTNSDLQWQENRKNRNFKKLTFEIK